jgi:hypothetical protein
MRSPGATITINQVDKPHIKPRHADFRDQFAVPNSAYLFPEWNEEQRADKSRKHIALLHGHGELRFINLAVPHPTQNQLMWWSDDLLGLPHVATTAPAGEGPTESPDAEIVDEIIKKVRDDR